MIEIKNHKITNRSIEHEEVDEMLAGETVDILYSDPPWGDGNLKYWVTMNKKMTGKEFTPLTFEQLLNRIMSLANNYLRGYIFIETGFRWEQQVADILASNGFDNIAMQHMPYSSGVCTLVYGNNIGSPIFDANVEGMSGLSVPMKAIGRAKELLQINSGIVLDPCCGMGYTAKSAVKHGLDFRGNEFNAKRLQKTIDFLKK